MREKSNKILFKATLLIFAILLKASLRGSPLIYALGVRKTFRTTKQSASFFALDAFVGVISNKIFRLCTMSIFLFVIFYSCKKLSLKPILKIKSDSVYVQNNAVYAVSTIVDYNDVNDALAGHCWSTNHNPTISDALIVSDKSMTKGSFSTMLISLNASTHYYVRPFIMDHSGNISYGNEMEITTSGQSIIVTNGTHSIIDKNNATISGNISNVGSFNFIGFGHCWSQNILPTISDNKTFYTPLSKDTTWNNNITGLFPGRNYYVRAYAQLDDTTIIYSDTTIIYIPELKITTDSYLITGTNTATIYGSINEIGVVPVTEHGFCWSYSTSQPDINENKISLGNITQTGSFYNGMTGIIQGVKYYFRAYAIEGTVVKYGTIMNFTIN